MYTRTRNKGTKQPLPALGQGFHSYGNGTKAYFAGGARTGWKDGPYVTTKDREIPGFRALSAKGFVFINPFESSSEIRVFSDKATTSSRVEPPYPGESTSYIKSTDQPGFLRAYGTAINSSQPMDVFGPDHEGISARVAAHSGSLDVAWNEALAGMAETNALLLVTAAEMGKTIEMIRNLALLFHGGLGRLEYLNSLRPGRKWTADGIAQAVMAEWLKLRYGIMPTFYEIQGVVNALTNPPKPPRVTSRGQDSWQDTFTRTRDAPPSSGMYPGAGFTSFTTISCSVRAGILYEPKLDTLSSRLGLHPSAIPETAFELVRLSFVADWFMDLSTTLRAMQASVYGRSLGGWITERLECVTRHTVYGGSDATGTVMVSGSSKPVTFTWTSPPDGATATAFYTYKKRTPVEGLMVKTPSLRVRISAARAADALALCGTILGSSFRRASRTTRF